MKNILCKCTVCSGLIDCAEPAGTTVQCPHCQMDTIVYDPTPAPEPGPGWLRRNWKTLLLGVVTASALVVIILLTLYAPEAWNVAGILLAAIAGMAVMALAVVVVAMWVLFPVVVYLQLESMLKLLRKIASK